MTIKVVPLHAHQGIKFDLILPDHYAVTIELSEADIRHIGPYSMTHIVELRVLAWLAENNYETDSVSIIFC